MPSDTPSSAPAPPPHRRLRQLGVGLLTGIVALAGVVGLLLFFAGRDHSQLHHAQGMMTGPGQAFPDQGHMHLAHGQHPAKPYASNPPTSGPHVVVPIRSDADGTRLSDDQILHALELGDVVLLYGTPHAPAALSALARRVSGGFDPALAASGQAVVLGRRPGVSGVVALAWRHLLNTRGAADPALEQFTSFWLGRGAGG